MEKASQSFLCVVVSVLLVFGLMPTFAYADSSVANQDTVTQEQLDDGLGSLDEEDPPVSDSGDNITEGDNPDTPSNSLPDDNVNSIEEILKTPLF